VQADSPAETETLLMPRGSEGRVKLRSVFEKRFRRPVDDHGSELLLESGEPVLVVAAGQPAGVRAKDGSLIPFPEREARVQDFVFDDATEWILVGGRWRERWR
jgi:hypothetical protein